MTPVVLSKQSLEGKKEDNVMTLEQLWFYHSHVNVHQRSNLQKKTARFTHFFSPRWRRIATNPLSFQTHKLAKWQILAYLHIFKTWNNISIHKELRFWPFGKCKTNIYTSKNSSGTILILRELALHCLIAVSGNKPWLNEWVVQRMYNQCVCEPENQLLSLPEQHEAETIDRK